MQEEKYNLYKEMMLYKEQVAQYKEANRELEKEKVELLDFRVSTSQ